jgi:metallo-beta-lactamase family protein
MRITFLGGADTVTGSRHLVEIGGRRVLLDCGMFQGYKVFRERNWAAPEPVLHGLDAVVLSHAHLDHSGWLPVLMRHGAPGRVLASPATRDLAEVMLLDSAHLQEEDARRANRYGYSRHAKALPLYTTAEAERAIARIRALRPGVAQVLGVTGDADDRGAADDRDLTAAAQAHAEAPETGTPGPAAAPPRRRRARPAAGTVEIELTPAGHLLGACSVTLRAGQETLVYSGDLGRSADLLMPPPQRITRADVLIVESTYGNRWHPPEDAAARLGAIIRATIDHGGSVLLPSFAVGRAQALLLVLQRLKAAGKLPRGLPIFLDSPMATQATTLYRRHRDLLRVDGAEIEALLDGVRVVTTPLESSRLSRLRYPAVIISASGMATGGRVLHHLKALAPDARHHNVFAGFQVAGSRGAHLVAGATEVKIHGEYVPVRAAVTHIEGFSGHADSDELMAWLRGFRKPPRQTFVVHGDPEASDALRVRIQDELGWAVRVPAHGAAFEV